jgi:hypothetical protein
VSQGEDDTVTIDAGAASYLNNADDLGALGGGAAGMFAPNIADMLGASRYIVEDRAL